jgi:hypothetical protein
LGERGGAAGGVKVGSGVGVEASGYAVPTVAPGSRVGGGGRTTVMPVLAVGVEVTAAADDAMAVGADCDVMVVGEVTVARLKEGISAAGAVATRTGGCNVGTTVLSSVEETCIEVDSPIVVLPTSALPTARDGWQPAAIAIQSSPNSRE